MEKIAKLEADILEAKDLKEKISLQNTLAQELRNIDPKRSLSIAEEALKLSQEILYPKGKAESLQHIGFSYMHASLHEKALSTLLESLSLFEEIKDEKGAANVNYSIGLVHLRAGVFDQALRFLHNSLEYRTQISDKSGMAACYFQLSYISQHFNDAENAMENIQRSIEIRRELNDKSGLAASLMVLGEIYMKRKDLVKAREMLHESLELRKSSPEKMGHFASMLRWAELHIELGAYTEALEFAKHGLEMAASENIHFGMMRFFQLMGRIELALEHPAKAKECYSEAMRYAEKYSYKSIQYEILESMSELLKLEGDHKTALEYFERFHKLKEEVISLQTNSQLKSVQFVGQIEFARKEAELEKLKNTELKEAYSLIEEKQKEILDSIRYAKRIQTSLLPTTKYIEKNIKRLNK